MWGYFPDYRVDPFGTGWNQDYDGMLLDPFFIPDLMREEDYWDEDW